ncbi:M56 family metallopeptidase, partial [Parapedobacter sp. DT-150]|uniref:M56 family metallopeptidase n=1 Tax=Parapedobacter sp. DT-150 TaxID=3396162 RepID=UPI003F1A193B
MISSLNNLIEAIGWSILHSLWIGALVYGLLLLLYMIFPEADARTRYAMSFSSLVVLFIGFLAVFFSKLELSFDVGEGANIRLPFDMAFFLEAPESRTPAVFSYLAGGYLVGVAAQMLLLAIGYFRLNRMRRVGLHPVPLTWERVFSSALSYMAVRKPVSFWLSERVNVPLVVGYFKPVVLFPLAVANQLDADQVEAILIHELSHIRRNDYLLNLFKTVMETLMFFNPFVWLLGRMISQEREHACDDMVVLQTGKPIYYAQTLLQVAVLAGGTSPNGLAMAAAGKSKSQLLSRIKRITNMNTKVNNLRQQLLVLAFAVLAAVSVAWVQSAHPETNKQDRKDDNEFHAITPSSELLDSTETIILTSRDTVIVAIDSPKVAVDLEAIDTTKIKAKLVLQMDSLQKVFESDEWKKQWEANQWKFKGMADSLQKVFESDEWKKQWEANQWKF